ncbi:HTH-type transcriptional regulator [Melia azedarach]|uniref:HTH-type transcriptional regulator n=1 Tax=Melia azedarach TaxID=155640 RepID=A0ACC1XU27_MELAZ|nr:HTH-type transcriptional regulator [Melia azedarach]
MGLCSSCESTHVATAKLILQDGRLQEFSYPVKVSYVLQKNPACFICNSDEMEFDDVVSAISDDEELQPGQLYFALPLSRLKHPLQAEEMASLAVKASAALMKSVDKCGCSKKSVCPVVFSGDSSPRKMESGAGRGGSAGGLRRGRGGRKFNAMLSAIPE